MEEQPKTSSVEPSIASLEVDLFGTLLDYYQRIVALVRQAQLDQESTAAVHECFNSLLEEIRGDLQNKKSIDLKARLESVYEEVKRTMDELASGGGKQPGQNA